MPLAYLQQLPAEAIEKIEIITNPSVKYDPEGMSGIINIILKKDQLTGFNGSVRGSVATLNDNGLKLRGGNSGANFNYRNGKINLFANLNWRSNKRIITSTNNSVRTYKLEGGTPEKSIRNQTNYNEGSRR